MLEEKIAATALSDTFVEAAADVAPFLPQPDIYAKRIAVLGDFVSKNVGDDADEFDMAACLVMGRTLSREEADAIVDRMTDEEADAYARLADFIEPGMPLVMIEAAMTECDLLPGDYKRPALSRQPALEI